MTSLLKPLIFIIIFISLIVNASLIPYNDGLWWDEAVYMGLAESISDGYYSLDMNYPLETFRPFIFPFIISPVSSSLILARYIAVVIAGIAIISVYYATKNYYDKNKALWAAFFTGTSYHFVFFTPKVLSESLFILFLSLSLLFFFRIEKDRRYVLLCGVFASLGFMTRYMGGLIILSYLIYLIYSSYKKREVKTILLYIIGTVLALIPFFLIGMLYYGHPLGMVTSNLSVYSESVIVHTFLEGLTQLVNAWSISLVLIIPGVYLAIKKRDFLLIPFILTIVAFFTFPHKEPRYLLSFLPIYAMIAALGLNGILDKIKPMKKQSLISILIILAFSVFIFYGLQDTYNDRVAANSLVKASMDLKGLTSEGEKIMTNAYPYTYYISERIGIQVPMNSSEVMNLIEEEGIRYVVIYKPEPTKTEYEKTYFQSNPGFKKVKTYYQWGDDEATVIFEKV